MDIEQIGAGGAPAGEPFTDDTERQQEMKKLQVLGMGCPKCKQLAANAEAAARALGIEYQLEKVTEIQEIMAFGVMTTPALVVDGQVKVVGKVPAPEAIKGLLS